MKENYKNTCFKKIEEAEVYDVAIKSPLEFAKNLSKRLENKIFLKREDPQPVFSFNKDTSDQNPFPNPGSIRSEIKASMLRACATH